MKRPEKTADEYLAGLSRAGLVALAAELTQDKTLI